MNSLQLESLRLKLLEVSALDFQALTLPAMEKLFGRLSLGVGPESSSLRLEFKGVAKVLSSTAVSAVLWVRCLRDIVSIMQRPRGRGQSVALYSLFVSAQPDTALVFR
ncbi:hypothetical protein ALP47_200095 [Pseudomonas savastanoi]|uniref:hypothetical protein n=1 Tax=Pseudomonas syringae group TaxID=136849 RepID=UPI000F3AA9C5|nr:hypothetical protein ALP47_200095 [Pseudomonas savastanoi]